MPQEVPVYLFTGFLEAGKTKFIQEILEDSGFNDGERTLLLLCEEGLEEYDPSRFSFDNVVIKNVESEEDVALYKFETHQRRTDAEKVIIEYNGMWPLDKLFAAMPEGWIVYQEFFFADANTFLTYNANMRQQTYDKLKTCDTVVFNRFSDKLDRMELHKVVRAASRRAEILYEYGDGRTERDDIEDPLPFDKDAPVIEIADKDYALWYRDLDEEMAGYEGKTVRFGALAADSSRLPENVFVVGRPLMTCCEADIRMAGLACEWSGGLAGSKKPEPRGWFVVTARIHIKASPAYGGSEGPVLEVIGIEPGEVPGEGALATFY